MVRMIGYLEAFLDQCGNTLQGPQVGRVPGPERTFQEILRQPRFLFPVQPRWTPGCGSGTKSLDPVFLVCLTPSYDRTLRCREQSCNGRHGFSLEQEADGLPPPPFQLLSASLWSHTTQCNYKGARKKLTQVGQEVFPPGVRSESLPMGACPRHSSSPVSPPANISPSTLSPEG